ncbi:MAG: hypothetical protein QGI45_16860, partial [Myxococcota bacterium]|nr:hypothetical protein [Myxococcota bacterium]
MKILVAILLILNAAPAFALSLTIYAGDYALLKEPIAFNLSKGRSSHDYTRLPDAFMPDTAFLKLPGTRIVYQKYNPNFFNAATFLQKNVGARIEVSTTHGENFKGKLLAVDNQSLTLKDGRELAIFNRKEVVRVELREKGALETTPRLTWDIEAKKTGTYKGELFYMASGFDWETHYRLELSSDGKNAELFTDALLMNNTDRSYADAKVQLVAGSVKRGSVPRHYRMKARESRALTAMDSGGAGSGEMAQEALADTYLYSIKEKISLPQGQSIRTPLYPSARLPVQRFYIFSHSGNQTTKNEALSVQYHFKNDKAHNLNKPLPEGSVRLYQENKAKDLTFIGADHIAMTPKGEEIKINSGRAFDVVGDRIVKDHHRDRRNEQATLEIEVRN